MCGIQLTRKTAKMHNKPSQLTVATFTFLDIYKYTFIYCVLAYKQCTSTLWRGEGDIGQERGADTYMEIICLFYRYNWGETVQGTKEFSATNQTSSE